MKILILMALSALTFANSSAYRLCGDNDVMKDHSLEWSISHCEKVNGEELSKRIFVIDGEEVEATLQSVYFNSPKKSVCWGRFDKNGEYEELGCDLL